MSSIASPAPSRSTAVDPPLSRWWVRCVLIIMALGFCGLIGVPFLSYKNAPPMPNRIVDERGEVLFTKSDIEAGQSVFLKYGLMDNGTIWGHGAYLGPDFSAVALHQMGTDVAEDLAQSQYHSSFAMLDPMAAAAVKGEVEQQLKVNRYDDASDTLAFTAGQVKTYRGLSAYWASYFHDPAHNGGLTRDLVTDPDELRALSAFVSWAAWAAVAERPGS